MKNQDNHSNQMFQENRVTMIDQSEQNTFHVSQPKYAPEREPHHILIESESQNILQSDIKNMQQILPGTDQNILMQN